MPVEGREAAAGQQAGSQQTQTTVTGGLGGGTFVGGGGKPGVGKQGERASALILGQPDDEPPKPGKVKSTKPRISPSPLVAIAVPGTEVAYSADLPNADYDRDTSYYSYRWECINDPKAVAMHGAVPKVEGPDGEDERTWEATWKHPGDHTIVCYVQFHQPGRTNPAQKLSFIQRVSSVPRRAWRTCCRRLTRRRSASRRSRSTSSTSRRASSRSVR